MTSGAVVKSSRRALWGHPAGRGGARAAPARASRATPASGRPAPRRGSAAARGPCDAPRPGTGSGPGRCEWPPATAHPTARALARGAPGQHPARRAPSATVPTVDTPARDHSAAPTSRRSLRSSLRPPRRQREATLRCTGTLAQQLVLHRQLANVSLGSIQLGGQRLTGLRLQTELETGQRPGLPRLQAIELYPDFTRDRVQRLAAQQPAQPRPVCGSRSTVARAPRPPRQPQLGRRRLRAPCGLPPSAPTQLPSHVTRLDRTMSPTSFDIRILP